MAVVPPPIPAAQPVASVVPEISLNDSLAIRVCLLAAMVTVFAFFAVPAILPGGAQQLGQIGLFGAGGCLSVFFYQRRSEVSVSVIGGARLGWMTGAFVFVLLLALVTMVVLAVGPDQILDAAPKGQDVPLAIQQMKKVLSDGESAIAFLTLVVLTSFVTMSMIASVGGALGAKYFGQRHSS